MRAHQLESYLSIRAALGKEGRLATANVAFALAAPPTSDFSYLPVPSELVVTDDLIREKQIGLGEEIIAIGLHASRFGIGRNLPIMRKGIISCMPYEDEPLQDEASGLYYNARRGHSAGCALSASGIQ